ncbi:MAG: DUF3299 domain-containing protein [Bacteroidota bacterium]|nr:DUF3299 domain-containing protein [Bacteroidota bacterium]MDX5431326.1 DUF3299 domain-containing protein [Bacteroidota bacterium]MDX5470064.1 DUF3299 domain-containing protein [Bacteroidota bacterium]
MIDSLIFVGMKSIFLSIFLLFSLSNDPIPVSWKTLSDVKFDKKWDEKEGMYVLYPKFGNSVKNLEGKEIKISGYVIPVDYNENFYVLSAFPYSSCFFCGGAGPESVISLKFKKAGERFKTDTRLEVKGRLELNSSDIYEMNYILRDAEKIN